MYRIFRPLQLHILSPRSQRLVAAGNPHLPQTSRTPSDEHPSARRSWIICTQYAYPHLSCARIPCESTTPQRPDKVLDLKLTYIERWLLLPSQGRECAGDIFH
jgi:hypothetical protein